MENKELFEDYELKGWQLGPRIYKILGAAAALHLFAFVVIAQFNLLQTKACDSPYIGKVCEVLDMAYIGSIFLGTDIEFSDKDYEKTELEDADITYIDVSGQEPPFQYPEGYFALANPDQLALQQNQTTDFGGFPTDNGFPSNPVSPSGNDLLGTTPNLPQKNDNPTTGNIPDSPYSYGGNPTFPKGRKSRTPKQPKINNDSPETLPNLEGDEGNSKVAENSKNAETKQPKNQNTNPTQNQEQTSAENNSVTEVDINKKPLNKLAENVGNKVAKKEVDLNQPFSVVMEGAITKDGKLDNKKSRYVKSQGNQQMIDVAKDAIEAVGDSGVLGYLRNNGVEKVSFVMFQDDKQIVIKIISDQKIPEKANTTASQINTAISGLLLLDKNGIKRLDEDSKFFISNMKVTSEGKNFVLNFVVPKQAAQEIISRKLKEAEEKKNKPNSVAENINANAKS